LDLYGQTVQWMEWIVNLDFGRFRTQGILGVGASTLLPLPERQWTLEGRTQAVRIYQPLGLAGQVASAPSALFLARVRHFAQQSLGSEWEPVNVQEAS
jgi:hypothetical protein